HCTALQGNLNGYNAIQNVGNQVVQNAIQNPRIQNVGNQNRLIVVPRTNQNPNGNDNLIAARAEGNVTGHNEIQLQTEEFDLMADAADLDKIEEVNANCILRQICSKHRHRNYMQQPMPNPEDITDPTTAMSMALDLMAKAFKLNYSTPTNNNQRISSNPRNRQIAQPSINMGQDRQMQMLGGYSECSLESESSECWKSEWANWRRNAAYLQTQLLIAQKEEAGIQLQAKEFDLMAAAANLDEIEEVNANCILMANVQQV
nr:ribonuclease H-like domain-containing protein [Tanacetum cinerariifolium]